MALTSAILSAVSSYSHDVDADDALMLLLLPMLLMVMMLTDVDGIRHRRYGDSVVTTSSRILAGNQPQQQTH